MQKNIGSDVSGIKTSQDVAGPQEATTWRYAGDTEWITSDDILVFTFEPSV